MRRADVLDPAEAAPGPETAAHHWWSRDAVLVPLLCLLFAAGYTVFAVQRHDHFLTGYDSAIFDQVVRAYSHLHAPTAPIKGVHDFNRAGFDLLGDHFSPIWAVLAPLYRLWPNVELLLVAQASLFALSVAPVWVFTRRALGRSPAYLIAGSYGLSWGLQAALAADVHEIMFAVPLVAFALERTQAGKINQALAVAAPLMLVKEDLDLLLAAFGVYLFVTGRRWRGAATLVGGLAAFTVTTELIIPQFAVGHRFAYFAETPFHGGLLSAARYLVLHPASFLHRLVRPATKLRTLLWLTAPWLFAALLSPVSLLAVPLLLVRFLGNVPQWWTTGFQYNAVLMPVLTIAAVDGVRRLLAWAGRPGGGVGRRKWLAPAWATVVFGAAVWSCTVFAFHSFADRSLWEWSRLDAVTATALARVPPGVVVEAPDHLAPNLVDRDTVLLLDQVPRLAPWVVVDTRAAEFPFTSRSPELDRLRLLPTLGYRVVYTMDGISVWTSR
jgi:uncharacterized membrane protein